MIPKLLHRIWLDDPMPSEFAEYGRAWDRLHPDWTLIDWRDSSTVPTLRNAELVADAKRWTPDWKRWQSDIIRLELLWLYGGVYIDTDVEPLRPIDELVEDRTCVVGWSPNRAADGTPTLTNAVIAAAPHHPWINACVEQLANSARRFRGRHIAHAVGPWHLTRVWESGYWPNVTVLPAGVLYPQSIDARDRGEAADLSSAYAWHRWANTRDNRKGGVNWGTT